MPRNIRRYRNRKLYDTSESRYVTLQDLVAFVRAGEDVRVVHIGGEDVTAHTLAQALSSIPLQGDAATFAIGRLISLFRDLPLSPTASGPAETASSAGASR